MMTTEIPANCWSTLLIQTQLELFKIALELQCKNWTSFGIESGFSVCVSTQRLYQHKVKKWNVPFDEVAASHTAHTVHTHTAHCAHTHSPVLKSSLACERMRECSQIFPSFLPVIPSDLLLRAEFARSCSPEGLKHTQTKASTHTCAHTQA